MIITNLALEHNKIVLPLSLPLLVVLMFVNIGIIFMLHTIDPHKVLLKHLVWLIFVLIMSLIIYPLYVSSSKKEVISALFTTLFLTFTLSAVAYIKPEWISLSLGPILFFALLGVIVMELLLLFLFRNNLGNLVEAYQDVARRLSILHEQSNIRPIKFPKPKAVKLKKNK